MLTTLAYYIENFNTLRMLSSYPGLTADMVDSAANVTSIKALLVNISMGLLMLLGIVWFIKWLSYRKKKTY